MSTAPVKTKNLHNFSLPCLKWAHKNSTSRHLRSSSSRLSSDSPHNPSSQPENHPNHPLDPTQNHQETVDEPQEPSDKPWGWNLRPRKPVFAQTEPPSAAAHGTDCVLKGGVHKNERRDKKTKLWIALSREEIEEDLYFMSGSKPARRPKKRTKTVQKQVDDVFPGLYLAGASADSYRVHIGFSIRRR